MDVWQEQGRQPVLRFKALEMQHRANWVTRPAHGVWACSPGPTHSPPAHTNTSTASIPTHPHPWGPFLPTCTLSWNMPAAVVIMVPLRWATAAAACS